jgi:hypothetical protein
LRLPTLKALSKAEGKAWLVFLEGSGARSLLYMGFNWFGTIAHELNATTIASLLPNVKVAAVSIPMKIDARIHIDAPLLVTDNT